MDIPIEIQMPAAQECKVSHIGKIERDQDGRAVIRSEAKRVCKPLDLCKNGDPLNPKAEVCRGD